MKKTFWVIFLSLILFSGCSLNEEVVILKDEVLDFSFGFLGQLDSTIVKGNEIEIVTIYSSNQEGSLLNGHTIEIEDNSCKVDLINPQSFGFGQEVKMQISCEKSFSENQIEGIINIQYKEGETNRFSQGNFLLTVDED